MTPVASEQLAITANELTRRSAVGVTVSRLVDALQLSVSSLSVTTPVASAQAMR